ncbi:TolB family protein [Bacillus sp. S10(2024)]|uniref:TolB family protein n=1 Tax=Bacillus sp. S10(2024) TaxID=3162886 RepID=UPI003D1A542E
MLKSMFQFFIFVFVFFGAVSSSYAESVPVQVAFIRNHNLWIKINGKEKQVTKGEHIANPEWSYDGKWLAYVKGKEANRLELYRISDGKKVIPFQADATNHQWSPKQNIIAFQSGGVLNIYDVEKTQQGFENVSVGVGDYGWYPDGKKFLVSSMSHLLPTGWTGAELFQVPLNANLDRSKVKHFYTLPKESPQFFAIVASLFQWSPDRKWISFLATPTASWSMDSNTLCIIGADGSRFEAVDHMLIQPKWFQWAPSKNILAYIEGEGRFIVENKHLKLKELPAFKQITFTPKGYVDWDFIWNNNTLITISRAKEAKWSNDPKKRPKPSLYQINVTNAQQLQITTPSKGYGDYYPYYITHTNQIIWIRSNGEQSDMWIANADGSRARKWIHNIDEAANYYEKRDWENVVSVQE